MVNQNCVWAVHHLLTVQWWSLYIAFCDILVLCYIIIQLYRGRGNAFFWCSVIWLACPSQKVYMHISNMPLATSGIKLLVKFKTKNVHPLFSTFWHLCFIWNCICTLIVLNRTDQLPSSAIIRLSSVQFLARSLILCTSFLKFQNDGIQAWIDGGEGHLFFRVFPRFVDDSSEMTFIENSSLPK